MSGYLSIQHSYSSSLPTSSSSPTDLHSQSTASSSSSSSTSSSSSSTFVSTPSSSSSPSSPRNHQNEVEHSNNEDPYKFEASRTLSGIYGLVVTFVGIGIINAAVIIPQEASSNIQPTNLPGLDSRYNNTYLVFLSAIGLLFMLSTFAYDVHLYRTYSTSVIDTTSSNTLKAVNRLFGFAAVMYMIMSVVTILYKLPYNLSYENITWVCFYLAQLIYLDRYSQVCFRKCLIYKRFGIMHLLATNIVFWFEIVVYDTQEDYSDSEDHPICTLTYDQDHNDFLSYVGSARTYVGAFAAEYCLIAVCLLRSMWSNVGRTVIRRNNENISKHSFPIMESLYGIIGGVLVLIIILALGVCVFIKPCPLCWYYFEITVVVYGLVSLCSLICMINTNLLEERPKPEEFTSSVIYDGVLLIFCLSLFILQTMYTTVSIIIRYKTTHIQHGYTLLFIAICLYFFFPISQTVLIIIWQTHTIDRSRRHRLYKNLLIFLTISNFALWICGHYELKLEELFITEAHLYGTYMWYIIHHITGPFLILYSFHSSVCLFEIWTLFGSV